MSAENLHRPSNQPLIQSRAVQQQEDDQLATTVVQTAPRLDLDLGRARRVSLISARQPFEAAAACAPSRPDVSGRAGGAHLPCAKKTRDRKKRTIQALFVAAAAEEI